MCELFIGRVTYVPARQCESVVGRCKSMVKMETHSPEYCNDDHHNSNDYDSNDHYHNDGYCCARETRLVYDRLRYSDH